MRAALHAGGCGLQVGTGAVSWRQLLKRCAGCINDAAFMAAGMPSVQLDLDAVVAPCCTQHVGGVRLVGTASCSLCPPCARPLGLRSPASSSLSKNFSKRLPPRNEACIRHLPPAVYQLTPRCRLLPLRKRASCLASDSFFKSSRYCMGIGQVHAATSGSSGLG